MDNDIERGSRDHLAFAVQEEKIELLKLLFTIFYSDDQITKNSDVVNTTIEYLRSSCNMDQYAATAH